ncbi:uncharacterized protein LOC125000802 [Mugil cephalus]|uniref:uncharacterized protein LOC125000802 n=1 Tax=Mugil cephalus TaxID=48193 RepID=UPI001FB57A3B|nr:uncharacterized protein LOC125000802 [Mugil cephalus]
MIELLMEESKETLRIQMWEFQMDGFHETYDKPLARLVWNVCNSMKNRDVEYEARSFLHTSEPMPPNFQHPTIISMAKQFARRLTEKQFEAPGSKQHEPWQVVAEVVPKVLQGFWDLPPNLCVDMPSKKLCKMAVGVTKAVEDRVYAALSSTSMRVKFTRAIRDVMVRSIRDKVRQAFTEDVLKKSLNWFAAELLNTIVDVAVEEICSLFLPDCLGTIAEPPVLWSSTQDATEEPESSIPVVHQTETTSAVAPPPPPAPEPATTAPEPATTAPEPATTAPEPATTAPEPPSSAPSPFGLSLFYFWFICFHFYFAVHACSSFAVACFASFPCMAFLLMFIFFSLVSFGFYSLLLCFHSFPFYFKFVYIYIVVFIIHFIFILWYLV